MQNGVYKEAKESGFSDQQAGFMARLSIEIKSEADSQAAKSFTRRFYAEERLIKEKRNNNIKHRIQILFVGLFIMLSGVFIGISMCKQYAPMPA